MDYIRPKSETVGTYYERLGANANTTTCFALSEFIDNSIEAYERVNNGSCNGCKITVRFITEDKINGSLTELQNIRITDNGSGIKRSKIEEVISKYEGHEHNNVKTSIEKGNFGIGLKFGSFVLGKGFSINTKAKGEEELWTEVIVTPDNKDIPIHECNFPIKQGEKLRNKKISTPTGTIVEIKDIKHQFIWDDEKIKKFAIFLQFRYCQAIHEGCQIKIEHSMVDSSGKEDVIYGKLVGEWQYKYFSVNRIPKNNSPKSFISNINEENLKEFICNCEKTKVFDNPLNEEQKKICGDIEEPWKLMLEEKGLNFEYDFKIDGRNSIHIKWGFVSQEYATKYDIDGEPIKFSSICGQITELAKRWITHPLHYTSKNDEFDGGLKSLGLSHGSGPKALFILNFDNISDFIVPEPNKKTIKWTDRKIEKLFNEEIGKIKAFVEHYFTDSLQPILDFIAKGCVLENRPSEENISIHAEQSSTNNDIPIFVPTSDSQQANHQFQSTKELSPKQKPHILTKDEIIKKIKEIDDETKLEMITEIIEM